MRAPNESQQSRSTTAVHSRAHLEDNSRGAPASSNLQDHQLNAFLDMSYPLVFHVDMSHNLNSLEGDYIGDYHGGC